MKLALILCLTLPVAADVVREARSAMAAGKFSDAEALVGAYRKQHPTAPETANALAWLGRGALGAKDFTKAEAYSGEARSLALQLLKTRKLDAETQLPLALGAAIEVRAQALTGKGERAEAVAFLKHELVRWRDTSIRTRIQKNLHLLSLEGKPAPPLEKAEIPAGKPRLLFFWAHWCPDCKAMAPTLARIQDEFPGKGLVVIGPTRHYGYVAGGAEAAPQAEARYIAGIREQFYAGVRMQVPLSEENFRAYGASTTPTVVLVDAAGIVRLYHPGAMSYQELSAAVRGLQR